jgi:hypothetical protein
MVGVFPYTSHRHCFFVSISDCVSTGSGGKAHGIGSCHVMLQLVRTSLLLRFFGRLCVFGLNWFVDARTPTIDVGFVDFRVLFVICHLFVLSKLLIDEGVVLFMVKLWGDGGLGCKRTCSHRPLSRSSWSCL